MRSWLTFMHEETCTRNSRVSQRLLWREKWYDNRHRFAVSFVDLSRLLKCVNIRGRCLASTGGARGSYVDFRRFTVASNQAESLNEPSVLVRYQLSCLVVVVATRPSKYDIWDYIFLFDTFFVLTLLRAAKSGPSTCKRNAKHTDDTVIS